MSAIVFVCVLGGAFLGMFLRNRLPKHHLSGETKDVVKLGTGLIGTIAALVLGLLIASANSTFQTQSSQVQQLIANVIVSGPNPGAVRARSGIGFRLLISAVARDHRFGNPFHLQRQHISSEALPVANCSSVNPLFPLPAVVSAVISLATLNEE
jgi:hypothetical protein